MAETKYQRLIRLLKDMFQLGDAAELDFGIYRIMHARKAEIEKFLDQELFQRHVKEALAKEAGGQRGKIEEELEALAKTLKDAGVKPEDSPKYQELVAKRDAEPDQSALEDEVYANLLTFFGRYYSEGDFISQRRYGDDAYAIPYNGEEVKLHWANHDQYYIKSSEDLKHYAFLVGPETNRRRVRFRLVAATTERDNVKEKAGQERWHIVSDKEPITEEAGELVIPFEYRIVDRQELVDRLAGLKAAQSAIPQTGMLFKDDANGVVSSEDAAASEAESEVGKRPNMRDQLASIGAKAVLASEAVSAEWRSALEADYKNAEGEATGRSVIEHHIRRYLAKATFDYFIHKDLGGFLHRELDWYIKNELVQLKDILDENQTLDQLGRRHFAKLRVLQTVAAKLIGFLAQLEEFQKKLWLKKKFVLTTRYVVQVVAIPSVLHKEILESDAQVEEWKSLLGSAADKFTSDSLHEHPSLWIDTVHYDADFQWRLFSHLEGVDELTHGNLFCGDNHHALGLMQIKMRDCVKCCYIDPPYNTGYDNFAYKDSFKDSSWSTMIRNRLELAHGLLGQQGVLFCSINEVQRNSLEWQLREAFGHDNRVEELIWVRDTVSNNAPTYSTNHEYILAFARDRSVVEASKQMFRETRPGFEDVVALVEELQPNYPPIADVVKQLRALYSEHKRDHREQAASRGESADEAKKSDPWKGLYPYKWVEYRDTEGKYVEEAEAQTKRASLWVFREVEPSMPAGKQSASIRDKNSENYRFYTPLHPVTGKPCKHPKRGWAFPEKKAPDRPSFEAYVGDCRIVFKEDHTTIPQLKYFLHEVETVVSTSVVRQYADGEPQLEALFGRKGLIDNPKPPGLVKRLVKQTTFQGEVVLDFFAGSGTTAQAVIDLCREDGTARGYVAVEMAEYFDTVLLPRVKKCLYTSTWVEGSPTIGEVHNRPSWLPQINKVLYLESYEDACDNIFLEPSKRQQEAFKKLPEAEREKYRLHYMLDVESRGSASLLNIERFDRPFEYTLRVTRDDVTREQKVDLVETFNWLLGLKVETIRLSKDKSFKDEHHGIVEVTGENPDGQRCLIVWRNTDEVPDGKLLDWFEKNRHKVKDFEWDFIYVNGDNTLENLKRDDETWTVRLIEQEFHRLMFEGTE